MQLIFLAAPGANKYFFIRDGLLTKDDARLRTVPFTTGRATLVEVKRTVVFPLYVWRVSHLRGIRCARRVVSRREGYA